MTHSLDITQLSNLTWHIDAPIGFYHKEDGDPLQPWHESIVSEVALFSQFLLSQKSCKERPELVALAYWCRRSNLKKMSSDYQQFTHSNHRQPMGKVFHIAPANVDTVFFYSLILSMLSGNKNIVRISERSGELCRQLIELFQQFIQIQQPKLIPRLVAIVEYSATETATTATFSQWCDLRVIWGGDSAITAISAIEPSTKQLSFPDRYSIAVCQLNEEDNIKKVASAFVADFLPFNQQACSSPKALFWLDTPASLQTEFYQCLKVMLDTQENFKESHQVERHINLQEILLISDNQILAHQFKSQLAHVELQQINSEHLIAHQGNSLLLGKNIEGSAELPFHEKLQTISYYGIDKMQLELINIEHGKRIVCFGSALTFNHIWDGVNLLASFSKIKFDS